MSEEFLMPKVKVVNITDKLSRFIVEPLERGYAETLGNSMRRVLLNSLTGARARSIKIEGVEHEFTSVDGVVEDICDIVLNIKGLVFKRTSAPMENNKNEENKFDRMMNHDDTVATAYLEIEADEELTVTGADLKMPAQYTCINPDHVIAHMAEGGSLKMEINIGIGRGRVVANDNKRPGDPIGLIAIDSNYSPVRRCTQKKESTRVGQYTDFDKMVLEIETDGSITPVEAANRSANIITQHMNAFLDLISKNTKKSDNNEEENYQEESIFAPVEQEQSIELEKYVEDLDFSVRSYNCLKNAEIDTVKKLVSFSEKDLMNLRNFGQKSIDEVKTKLESMGLSLKKD